MLIFRDGKAGTNDRLARRDLARLLQLDPPAFDPNHGGGGVYRHVRLRLEVIQLPSASSAADAVSKTTATKLDSADDLEASLLMCSAVSSVVATAWGALGGAYDRRGTRR